MYRQVSELLCWRGGRGGRSHVSVSECVFSTCCVSDPPRLRRCGSFAAFYYCAASPPLEEGNPLTYPFIHTFFSRRLPPAVLCDRIPGPIKESLSLCVK